MFDDRAPLWTAAWDAVEQQFKKNPIFVDVVPIAGTLSSGDRTVEIDLMAHNISLLLLQEYGLWGGCGLYLVYLMIFCRKEIRECISKSFNTCYAPIGAACLGHAIMGGFAGQYVMNVEFSFLLYSMLGCVFYQCYCVRVEQMKANRNAYPVAYQYSPA